MKIKRAGSKVFFILLSLLTSTGFFLSKSYAGNFLLRGVDTMNAVLLPDLVSNMGTLRNALVFQRGMPLTYVNACRNTPDSEHTISFDVTGVVVMPAHLVLNGPMEIPADCKATKITINGLDTNGRVSMTPGVSKNIVIDGRKLADGQCAFVIKAPNTEVIIQNFDFINTKGPAVCVETDAKVTLNGHFIGKRRSDVLEPIPPVLGGPKPHPETGRDVSANKVGIKVSGNQTTITSNTIVNNTEVGIQIETNGVVLSATGNTIQSNKKGVEIKGNKSVFQKNTISNNKEEGILISSTAQRNTIGAKIGEDPAGDFKNTIENNGTSTAPVKRGGIILEAGTTNTMNLFSGNVIFNNVGLGIDVKGSNDVEVTPMPDNLIRNFVTLFDDGGNGPNLFPSFVSLAEDVKITLDPSDPDPANRKYLYKALLRPGKNPGVEHAEWSVELYYTDNETDASTQVRKNTAGSDERSYGEGREYITRKTIEVKDLDNDGRFTIPFTYDPAKGKGISSLVILRTKDNTATPVSLDGSTSEFSARVEPHECKAGEPDCRVCTQTTPQCPCTVGVNCPLTKCEGNAIAPLPPTDLATEVAPDRSSVTVKFKSGSSNSALFELWRASGTCAAPKGAFGKLTNPEASTKNLAGFPKTIDVSLKDTNPLGNGESCYKVVVKSFTAGEDGNVCEADDSARKDADTRVGASPTPTPTSTPNTSPTPTPTSTPTSTPTGTPPPNCTVNPNAPGCQPPRVDPSPKPGPGNPPDVTVVITPGKPGKAGFCIYRTDPLSVNAVCPNPPAGYKFWKTKSVPEGTDLSRTYSEDDIGLERDKKYCYYAVHADLDPARPGELQCGDDRSPPGGIIVPNQGAPYPDRGTGDLISQGAGPCSLNKVLNSQPSFFALLALLVTVPLAIFRLKTARRIKE